MGSKLYFERTWRGDSTTTVENIQSGQKVINHKGAQQMGWEGKQ
jgi:hypothetical protein